MCTSQKLTSLFIAFLFCFFLITPLTHAELFTAADLLGENDEEETDIETPTTYTGTTSTSTTSNTILSREQMAKDLVEGLNISLDTSGSPAFADVTTSNVFYDYIQTLANKNIIDNKKGFFHPDTYVTRNEATTFLKDALAYSDTNSNVQYFSDVPPTSTYFIDITTLAEEEVIPQELGSFNGKDQIKRSDFLSWIVNAGGTLEGYSQSTGETTTDDETENSDNNETTEDETTSTNSETTMEVEDGEVATQDDFEASTRELEEQFEIVIKNNMAETTTSFELITDEENSCTDTEACPVLFQVDYLIIKELKDGETQKTRYRFKNDLPSYTEYQGQFSYTLKAIDYEKTWTFEIEKKVKTFPDISDGYWAKDAISLLAEKEIVKGKEDGRFDPTGTLTGAELLKMVLLSSGETLDFSSGKTWQTVVKEKALANNIIESSFSEENTPINRENASVIILKQYNIVPSAEIANSSFPDVTEEMNWKYIEEAKNRGILKGYENGNFGPNDTLQRDQFAAIVYRIITKGL